MSIDLKFFHISSQKWLVFANYFGLPTFYPNWPIFLLGYIRHIRDIFQLWDGGVNLCGVEDDEGHYVDNVNDEEGWDPDQGGVDEVIVEGADADDEEGVGGDGDGGEDDAEYTEPNENFMADNSILKLKCVICKRNVTKHTFRDTLFDNGGNFRGR